MASTIGVSTLPTTIINPLVECVTMVTDYNRNKTICTNGRNCTGRCVIDHTGQNYCLTNVKFLNVSPSQFIGYYNPCRGRHLSPLF